MKPDSVPMFDSHCHLQMAAFAGDLPSVLERAHEQGIEGTVVIGMDPPSSRQAVDLANRYEGVYATVGVHPHDASCLDGPALQSLREMAREPRVVAIGETGLDFYRNLSPPAMQKRAFREQLALADELGLPVVIHSRQANQDTLAILQEWAKDKAHDAAPLGVLHCFAGDAELAEQYAHLGFMLSFAGNVTYPNASRLQSVAAIAPMENLLVETDCPFLPPQGHRGRRCEPAHIRETLQFIADLRKTSVETLAAATTANAKRLYRLQEKIASG
jgi:TatD DNase family protein